MSTAVAAREAPAFARDRLVQLWILMKSLSDAGDAIWTIALAWTAVQVASPATAGLVVAAGTIPRAVVLLVGGVVADRYDARRVMVVANTVRVVVLVAAAVWVTTTGPSVLMLLLVAIAFGITDAVHEPAASTIGRQLVRPADLPAFGGLAQLGNRLGTMIGAAIGGFLVANAGIEGSASVDALTFVGIIAFLAIWLRPRHPLDRADAEPVLRSIRGGFTHLRRTPVTRLLVLALSGLNLAVTPALGLGIPLRASSEGWGAQSVGLLEALVGLGAAVGALSMLRWKARFPARTGFGCLVAQGVAIPALGLGPWWLSSLACLTIGVTAGVASALLGAVFMTTVDGAHLGRMVSIQKLGDDVFMPVAMVSFGALAGLTSVTVALCAFGTAMALLMLWPLNNRMLMSLRLGEA
ncbi:MFS transporter [Nocardioides jensenii]|uniref:MFS transporter n=1 Tax=Nocardioides jensenii TaxID=1843 RepID=UPI0008299AC8|nr:MFS transporter [Nocardioides jensenii]